MNEQLKRYEAVVCENSPESVGVRTFVLATDRKDARKRLELTYGADKVCSIWNEEDSKKSRGHSGDQGIKR